MPSSASTQLLSPAELSYLHTSLTLTPPIRPDSRAVTQFRPLVAETDVLPATNGSARICFADGTEAVVGVKAEVEKTVAKGHTYTRNTEEETTDVEMTGAGDQPGQSVGRGDKSWLELSIEIPGFRDDDSLPVYLAAMLSEALLATGELVDRLYINSRWNWKLYIDILLLSPPLSYPVPLLSLTTHLALLSAKLPALISEGDEDPLFNDDWDAALPLYPPSTPSSPSFQPPITLLVVSVGSNILFDPSKEELAVADAVLAVSLAVSTPSTSKGKEKGTTKPSFNLLAVRTVDPPSRLTMHGVPDSQNTTTAAGSTGIAGNPAQQQGEVEGVWKPKRGGMPRGIVNKVVAMCVQEGGVAEEVLAGLESFGAG